MRLPLTLAVTLAVLIGTLAPAVAVPAAALGGGDVRAPLADAGLDQHVDQGTTVHLDATGSRDLDGSIAHYEWILTDPSGATHIPGGFTSAQTTFVPTQPGRWEATLHVTDAAGHTSTDTLYVYVDAVASGPPSSGPPSTGPPSAGPPGTGPTTGIGSGSSFGGSGNVPPRVQIIGPSVVPPGENVRYEARTVDPDGTIVGRNWVHVTSGGLRGGVGTQASGASFSRYFSSRDSGRTVTISLTVEDDNGASVTATKRVRVQAPGQTLPLEIVGPDRLRSGETGTWSIRTFEGNFESYDWNIEQGTQDGTSASASWDVPNGSDTRTATVQVTGHLENGSSVQAAQTVTIMKFNLSSPRKLQTIETEFDLVDKRGANGIVRGLVEYLFWEERQVCRPDVDECVVGEDAGRSNSLNFDELEEAMTRTESEEPNTADLLVDDFDGGTIYSASMDLYETADGLDRRGDRLDTRLTRQGSRFGAETDEAAARMDRYGDSAGHNANELVDRSGGVTGRVVDETYEEGGRIAGNGASTAVRMAGGSEAQAEHVGTTVARGVGRVGDVHREGIETVTDAAGDGIEAGLRAGGDAAGRGVNLVGDGGETVADVTGDIGGSGFDIGARAAETVGDAGMMAGNLAQSFVSHGEGSDDDSSEEDSGWFPNL